MEQKYIIKGIGKIIEIAGKEKLAKHFGVDIDADFEELITNDFKEHNIPNGLEVALYFSLNPEQYNKAIEDRGGVPRPEDEAGKIYEQDERKRAMFGFRYMDEMAQHDEDDWLKIIEGTYGNVLYFFVDEPLKVEYIGDYKYRPEYMVGGVQYQGLIMGNNYYKEHKNEMEQYFPDRTKREAVEGYVENFMHEFKNVSTLGGYGPRPEYKETDKIRAEKEQNEKVILELTGKSSIDELSLKDFIALKRKLEKEEKDLHQQFEERFSKKEERG